MALTDLLAQPIGESVLEADPTALAFGLNPNFFNFNDLLTLLAAFDPAFAELVEDLAASLTDATGQVLVTEGRFEADFVLGDGTLLGGSFDAPTTLRGFADLAAVATGTATLSGGILTAAIAVEDQFVDLPPVDLAAIASTLAGSAVSAINATVPFTNGVFALDLATALGPIAGTIDVAGGDLNLDLTTPFGQLVADIDFGEDAVFPFTAPVDLLGSIDGVVDFNSGNIVVDGGILGDLVVPIAALSGSLDLADGTATLTTSIPLGAGLTVPVTADFEIGPLASEYVADLIQSLEGEGTLADGILTASLASPLGLFETTFDVVAFTNQGAEFFAGVDGVIDVAGGIATVALTTPLGDLNDTIDLTTLMPPEVAPLAAIA